MRDPNNRGGTEPAVGSLPEKEEMEHTGSQRLAALTLAAAVTASGHLRLACVAVWLGYALGASNLSPRPQTLSYPLFALFLLAVTRAEWRRDAHHAPLLQAKARARFLGARVPVVVVEGGDELLGEQPFCRHSLLRRVHLQRAHRGHGPLLRES